MGGEPCRASTCGSGALLVAHGRGQHMSLPARLPCTPCAHATPLCVRAHATRHRCAPLCTAVHPSACNHRRHAPPRRYYQWELLNTVLSYTVDLSNVACSCNAALYFVYPSRAAQFHPNGGKFDIPVAPPHVRCVTPPWGRAHVWMSLTKSTKIPHLRVKNTAAPLSCAVRCLVTTRARRPGRTRGAITTAGPTPGSRRVRTVSGSISPQWGPIRFLPPA